MVLVKTKILPSPEDDLQYVSNPDSGQNKDSLDMVILCNACALTAVNFVKRTSLKTENNLSFRRKNISISEVDFDQQISSRMSSRMTKSQQNDRVSQSNHAAVSLTLNIKNYLLLAELLSKRAKESLEYPDIWHRKTKRTIAFESVDLYQFQNLLPLVTPVNIGTGATNVSLCDVFADVVYETAQQSRLIAQFLLERIRTNIGENE